MINYTTGKRHPPDMLTPVYMDCLEHAYFVSEEDAQKYCDLKNKAIVKRLQHYREICNDILIEAESANIRGAINWADLKCYETKFAIDMFGHGSYQFFIDKADPDNEGLKGFVERKIQKILDDVNIEVFTEW